MDDLFMNEYRRVLRIVNDSPLGPAERKRAFDAMKSIRELVESEELEIGAASDMVNKLATTVRFAARSVAKTA